MAFDPTTCWWDVADGLMFWSDESDEHLQDILSQWRKHHDLRKLKKQFPNYGGEL